MNSYLIVILSILVGNYFLDFLLDWLNLRHLSTELPKEFEGCYDAQKYGESQRYLRETTRFHFIKDSFGTLVTIGFILVGGFNFVDQVSREVSPDGGIVTGLIFAAILMFASQVLGIPFAVYHTFVIEEKFGFNKTTAMTFILDILKGLVLSALLGGMIFALIIWIFQSLGTSAWMYCWISVTLFELFIMFIAPVTILPLFNKFTPLEDGSLKKAIMDYAHSQNFQLSGIFTIDGSKRSTKSNAYFTGFGKYRRIALYDTLIEQHSTEELVSILAHEIGHFKKKHIFKMLAASILGTGIMFFMLGFFINNEGLFAAFQMQHTSIYASLFFFGFLYSPISFLLGIASSIASRKHEYEADRFAAQTYKKPEAMISALKKLSVHNLSNLTPHPLKVFLTYSHPPVLERIKEIREL